MNCETFREQLADFVAGELSPQDRSAAAAHIRACAPCGELARGLQAAAALVEAGVPSLDQAEQRTADLTLPGPDETRPSAPPQRCPRAATLLRYAAAVLIAFTGGYLARGWRVRAGGATRPAGGAAVLVKRELADRYAAAAHEFPQATSFGRSLLALARR